MIPTACGQMEIKTLCHVNYQDGMCWISKEEGKGYTFEELDNFYALSEDDLRKVLDKLKECNE